MNVKPYLKSTAAGLVAAIAFLAPVVDDGVSASEALLATSAFLVGAGVVFTLPYQTTKKVDEATDGAVDLH